MTKLIENGTIQKIKGIAHIFYDDYWIRYYEPPQESLATKKQLIEALTRRTFHHTEPGINTPGEKLEQVRERYLAEDDADKKRVLAAMLAGALFNRATDIFNSIVDLEQKGIHVAVDGHLMNQCSECFVEAMSLCHNVRHISGEEGVDELWGEPFKVFAMSIKEYYLSRYLKIALTMREIDRIAESINETFCRHPWFADAKPLMDNFVTLAKRNCEILKSDDDYFSIWPEYIAHEERLEQFQATIPKDANSALERHIKKGNLLFQRGKNLIVWIANIRVPMKTSTANYLNQCEQYHKQSLKYL